MVLTDDGRSTLAQARRLCRTSSGLDPEVQSQSRPRLLDIFLYRYIMLQWPEQRLRQTRSMRWQSPVGVRSWTFSHAESDP